MSSFEVHERAERWTFFNFIIHHLLACFIWCFFPVGSFCNKNDTKCISSSCQNNSTCKDFSKDKSCRCSDTAVHGDKDCGKREDPLPLQPLSEHATCVRVPGRGALCRCPPGTAGPAVTPPLAPRRASSLSARGRLPPGLGAPCCASAPLATREGSVSWTSASALPAPACTSAVCRDGEAAATSASVSRAIKAGAAAWKWAECVSEPCQNAATCLKRIGRYTCPSAAGSPVSGVQSGARNLALCLMWWKQKRPRMAHPTAPEHSLDRSSSADRGAFLAA